MGSLYGPKDYNSSVAVTQGGWTYVNNDANFYNNNYNVSNVTGDEFLVNFHGTNAKIYGKKGSDCGKVDIYVDDVFKQTADFYSSTTQYKTALFDTGALEHGNHQVRFTLRSDKNGSATDKKIYLDYWQYTNVVETLPAPTIKNTYSSQGKLHIEWTNVIPGGTDSDTGNWAPEQEGAGYYVMWGMAAGTYNHKIDVGYATKVDFGLQEGIQNNTTYYVQIVPYTPERKEGTAATAVAYNTSCPNTQTIYNSIVPAGNIRSSQVLELGTEFHTTVPGMITKVRIYKSGQEVGEHKVTIFNKTDGTTVAGPYNWTLPSSKEGWYEFTLPQPISIVPVKTYTVSVSTPDVTPDNNTRYMYYSGLMDSSPIYSGYIVATGSAYGYTLGQRPNNPTGCGYFRDILFVPSLGQSICITWNIAAGIAGWREYILQTPLSVAANTDYTIDISTSTDKGAVTASGFFAAPFNNGNIVTYPGSGVYTYTLGSRPTGIDNNNGYMRDVVFVPD